MRKQIDIFFTAIMFFTRLPVPKRIDHGADLLQKSARYFPWIGIIVGSISCGVYLICIQILSPAVSIFLSMAASILTTGAFHEDGFADVCDAFGGGWTKEKILLIMKDSRLGSYGVIGLIGILGLKFLLLLELSTRFTQWNFFPLIISAHALSRFAGVTIIQQYQYVTEHDTSKSKPVASRKLIPFEMTIAAIGAIVPLIFLDLIFMIALVLVVISRIYLGNYFYKWIGGYTGDCLGATQQVCEVSFYLGIIILWKFT